MYFQVYENSSVNNLMEVCILHKKTLHSIATKCKHYWIIYVKVSSLFYNNIV